MSSPISNAPIPIRAGQGFDAHQLVSGRPLILGGVEVPHERGLAGHSDGDALTHAVIDALLGAAALGDIGQHFPSSDPELESVSSLLLLARVCALLEQHGWRPANIDATVVAERPRLAPHVGEMRQRLAATLRLELEAVSVKATTTDGLGFTGRAEGIAAFATAIIGRLGQDR
jgi:2-C-methyl-D-erythritol 2,4-cyclodiphosphate synthase